MRPTYEFTTLKKIIARTKIRLKIEHLNTEDLFLKDCVKEAAAQMSTKEDFVEKTAVLTITDNFTAQAPFDYVRLDRGDGFNPPLVFTQDGEMLTGNNFSPVVFTNNPFINDTPYQASLWNAVTVNEQNGVFFFSNNLEARECKISYLAVNLDENGDMMIPANNERAIMNYAMSEWGLANGLPSGVVQEYRRIWTQGKLDRRGQSKLLGTLERERMYRIMNSI